MNKTLNYYNENAEAFCENTINADMSMQYKLFEKYLSQGAHVLDLGCGSGRDTKYFISQGYFVEAVDGSKQLCQLASKLTGIEVKHMVFQDMEYKNAFEGVWACASLLHVPKGELRQIFLKIADALRQNGILYASFKYGNFEGERNGRCFTDMNQEGLKSLIEDIPELEIKEIHLSGDVRQGRDKEQWLNVILQKN